MKGDEVVDRSFATQHFVLASGALKHPHTFNLLQIEPSSIPAMRPNIYIQMTKFNYPFPIRISVAL